MKFSYFLIRKLLSKAPSKKKLVESLNLRAFEAENAEGDAFDVSLPPNRYSDAASHLGIAREAGAIFSLRLKSPVKEIVNPPENKGFIKLDVKDAKLCPRYSARYFELKHAVGASPKWTQDVLRACGLKPINAVVDIMNYVMLEVGQPLHAFDADRLAPQRDAKQRMHVNAANRKTVIVRRAKKGEKIKTLDGQKFVLDKDVLVIADKEKLLAIAGIKGGEDSGVTEKTKRIVVEAASFDPVFTHKAARKLNLQTDASLRFGHGISPALVEMGLDRATELLLKTGAWLLDTVDCYPKPAGDEVIEFNPAKYESIVGAPIDAKKARARFERLGFRVESPGPKVGRQKPSVAGYKLLVRVPPWRTDIEAPEDLIEEAARLGGYGKIKPAPPVVSAVPASQEDTVVLKDKVRAVLVGMQIDEVYSSSFVGDAELRGTNAERRGKNIGANQRIDQRRSALVEMENPISEDKKYLRPSLIPLLVKNAENGARFYDAVRIFEIGKTFSLGNRGVFERSSLGVVLAAKKDQRVVLEMKGAADELMRGLGVGDFSMVAAGDVIRVEVGNYVLGVLGHARTEKGWTAAYGEFDLDKILPQTEEAREFVPLKRFPAVVRDVSILVSPDVRIGDVVREIQLVNQRLIENADLIDEYVDEKLGSRQSLTFRIIFQADNRTLTDKEVNDEMEKIAAVLRREFRAEIR